MTSESPLPLVPLAGLDELWFQVAGTLCNLTCTHCFISCSPHNHSFEMLTFAEVQQALIEAELRGVKEFYFTGGEPFLNRELVPMLVRALDFGPVSVLTNATVLKPEWLTALRDAEARSRYSIEFRVSIDGPTPESNDPVRGEGTFARAMRGVGLLVEHGFLPIITMTRLWDDADDAGVLSAFTNELRKVGNDRPRMKILPRLKLGAEVKRAAGYAADEHVTAAMLDGYDLSRLVCHHSRIVTNRGVFVCPILIDAPEANLGPTLAAADRPFAITYGACSTCYQYGAICTNPSGSARP